MKRIGAVATVLVTLLVLAGCGSVQAGSPHLDRAEIGPDGVSGQVGQIRLLDVSITSPGPRGSVHIAGDDAALLLTIANDGKAADVLIRAGADVARRTVFRDGDAAPNPRLEVPVASRSVAVLSEVTGPHLELTQLHQTLPSGSHIPVTFEFRDAGSVTLDVPVAAYADVRPDKYSAPSP
jgi:copper(I)-binding protein